MGKQDPSSAPCSADGRIGKASSQKLNPSHILECLGSAAACSWIYESPEVSLANSPLGTILHYQLPDDLRGHRLKWAAILDETKTKIYLVFAGSCTPFDMVLENPAVQFAVKDLDDKTPLLMHMGFCTAVDNDMNLLADVLREAQRQGARTCIVCGHSKGGANAVAFAAKMMVPELAQLQPSPIAQKLKNMQKWNAIHVVSLGAPNVFAKSPGLHTVNIAFSSKDVLGSSEVKDALSASPALRKMVDALSSTDVQCSAWSIDVDPVPLMLSSDTLKVKSFLQDMGSRAHGWAKWAAPEPTAKFDEAVDSMAKIAQQYRPCLREMKVSYGGQQGNSLSFDMHAVCCYKRVVVEQSQKCAIESIDNEEPASRINALAIIQRLGDDGAEFMPRVMSMLKDKNEGVRKSAMETLAAMAESLKVTELFGKLSSKL